LQLQPVAGGYQQLNIRGAGMDLDKHVRPLRQPFKRIQDHQQTFFTQEIKQLLFRRGSIWTEG
jgi:hypothetical protein